MDIRLGTFTSPFNPWRAADGRIFDAFAFDCETTAIDDERPYLVPSYVLGTACDGRRGVFVTRDRVLDFFQAHAGLPIAFHNAAFDLRVLTDVVASDMNLYAAVEAGQVFDTMILHRLLTLATEGHPARQGATLDACARAHLGVDLPKDEAVRTGFGRFLGRPPADIPEPFLRYAAADALATWHLGHVLMARINVLLEGAAEVWGHAGPDWLADCIRRFGPLTHHVQLRAAILTDALHRSGIGIDLVRREE